MCVRLSGTGARTVVGLQRSLLSGPERRFPRKKCSVLLRSVSVDHQERGGARMDTVDSQKPLYLWKGL